MFQVLLNIGSKLYFPTRLLLRPKIIVHVNTIIIPYSPIDYGNQNKFIRFKYITSNSGVKGIKSGKKVKKIADSFNDEEDDGELMENNENLDLENDKDYDLLVNNAMHVTKSITNEQNVFIIQPYIKWGPKKTNMNPVFQLQEAESLIRSLPKWSIQESIKTPLESFSKKTFFGSGKLEEIRNTIRNHGGHVSCVFVSTGVLTGPQKRFLEEYFRLPVLDRYSVVIQILRLHAQTTESKLQVAMAEIPYIWSQFRDSDKIVDKRAPLILNDLQKQILRNREKKLKYELDNIRNHRELLRNRRRKKNYPVIAVVGYTNAGKTSLIKALTCEENLLPKDQLFATLDVTAHAGRLPCQLEVLYMDTVGFMSDIPTGLLECFISTLEDAMLADIIIHVQDVSHNNYIEQKKHVEETLNSLIKKSQITANTSKHIINVGNKFDLHPNPDDFRKTSTDLKLISSKKLTGIDELLIDIEKVILKLTNRVKMVMKVPNGGEEMAWLYKNAAVTACSADSNNCQQILLHVVIAETVIQQFKYKFLYNKEN